MMSSSKIGQSLTRVMVSSLAALALLCAARPAAAEGVPAAEGVAAAEAPALAPPAPAPAPVAQADDGEQPPALQAPEPPRRLPLLPPQTGTGRPAAPPPHRGLGIGLIVLGNLMQFAGVGLLVPAVMHQSDSSWAQRKQIHFGVGGGLDGLGNVVEAVGWGLAFGRRSEARRPVELAQAQ